MSSGGRLGRSLRLFLVDGTTAGIVTAELGVSTIMAVGAYRTALPDLLKREEARRTGVYLLLGPDMELAGRQLLYIGESDEVRERLRQHGGAEKMGFFVRALLIVAKDQNLTKIHALYLENQLIEAVRLAGRAKLVNIQVRSPPNIPEAEKADMARVLDDIAVLLPVMGFDVLGRKPAAVGVTPAAGVTFFSADIDKAKARAVEREGEFVVLAGSTANLAETPGVWGFIRDRRRALVESGALVPDIAPYLYRFTQDVGFDRPSTAAAVIRRGPHSGWKSWKIEGSGTYYEDWRSQRIAEATPA